MAAPGIHRLSKKELVWLATHTCKHRHNYLEHYACYLVDRPDTERLGFLDIETTNLDANFGIILSYVIKRAGVDEFYEGVIDKAEIDRAKAGDEDKRIVRQLVADLNNFDKIVTYYGKRFDVPFIRTRAISMGIPFPSYGTLKHTDLYDTIRHRMKLNSNRLENACRVLLGNTDKTRIEYHFWRAAARGNAKALEYVIDHNRKDVTDLEKLYDKVIDFTRKQDSSI